MTTHNDNTQWQCRMPRQCKCIVWAIRWVFFSFLLLTNYSNSYMSHQRCMMTMCHVKDNNTQQQHTTTCQVNETHNNNNNNMPHQGRHTTMTAASDSIPRGTTMVGQGSRKGRQWQGGKQEAQDVSWRILSSDTLLFYFYLTILTSI